MPSKSFFGCEVLSSPCEELRDFNATTQRPISKKRRREMKARCLCESEDRWQSHGWPSRGNSQLRPGTTVPGTPRDYRRVLLRTIEVSAFRRTWVPTDGGAP